MSIAAVIGRDFDIDLLGPVAGLPEPEMIEFLDRAVAAGLLSDIGPGRFTFAHAVIQHAQYSGLSVVRAILALIYCEDGDGQEADDLMNVDAADGFAAFFDDPFGLYGLVAYAEVCAARRALGPARALYDRLAPWHRQLPVVPPAASAGAVALYLGRLATVLDRFDEAESHFVEAMEIHEGLRAPYWIARTQLEHARMLLVRGRPDDRSRATALLDRIERSATEYGFAGLTRQSGPLRAESGEL